MDTPLRECLYSIHIRLKLSSFLPLKYSPEERKHLPSVTSIRTALFWETKTQARGANECKQANTCWRRWEDTVMPQMCKARANRFAGEVTWGGQGQEEPIKLAIVTQVHSPSTYTRKQKDCHKFQASLASWWVLSQSELQNNISSQKIQIKVRNHFFLDEMKNGAVFY